MDAQEFEASWWGTCANTYGEETKQLVYARYMDLELRDFGGPGPEIDLEGKVVCDIGGGPVSLLLKCRNGVEPLVIDPCSFPDWVYERYNAAGVGFLKMSAEYFLPVSPRFDEIWIYNVLQHVHVPETVLRQARERADVLRIFDWLDLPPHPGHPHELKRAELEEWLGATGHTVWLNEGGAIGNAFYGVFDSRTTP